MRRRFSVNAIIVVASAAAALLLTIALPSPKGILTLGMGDRVVRAEPGAGDAAKKSYDLDDLTVFNSTLLRVTESYVEPDRVDPKKMLYQALDSVQFNIPEVLVEPYPNRDELVVLVNDKKQTFSTANVDSPWRLVSKLRQVFRFIQASMDATKAGVDLAPVEYAAVNGMLSTLDPHSTLMDPESAREMDVSTSGKFGGLGIVIRMINRKLTVIRPMKDTPAFIEGIQRGDHIIKIDNDLTENLTLNEAVDRMRGKPKTKVSLWVERKGAKDLLRFDLSRAIIQVESVESKLLAKNVGLIRIKQFSGSTADEVAAAMDALRGQGANGWVLDLRWNPGGLLEQAIKVADLFVDSGTIVTTVGGRERDARRAERDNGDVGSPLAVLINGNSASASEIVAGALKNLDRALIIGGRSFGKGSVQVLYDNKDGSKLKLTIAQYLTPGDRSIQSVGIVPDVELQRMYVPTKNTDPEDQVRLLAPSRSTFEKDLDAHLTSSYAKDTDVPTYVLPFLYEPPAAATRAAAIDDEGEDGEAAAVPFTEADEEAALDDGIVEDYEITLARDLVVGAGADTRPDMVKAAKTLLGKKRGEEDKKLADALTALGIDWTAPTVKEAVTTLTATVDVSPKQEIKAGSLVTITATVTNTGKTPAYQVAARVDSDDWVFADTELVFGKIDAGQSKSYTTHLRVPKDAIDRVDQLDIAFREARGAKVALAPIETRVVALDRPVFAYAHQLVDLDQTGSNGDGLLERGESYLLRVTVKNAGTGEASKPTVTLRNAVGDGMILNKARVELDPIAPGASKQMEFTFQTTSALKGDTAIVELSVYDAVTHEGVSDKLSFPLHDGADDPVATSGVVEVQKDGTAIYEGAATSASQIAFADKGARFNVTATVGGWMRVELAAGAPGFVVATAVKKATGKATAAITPRWQVTPPTLTLEVPSYVTSDAIYTLKGKATDDTHVEDVYIYVSNQEAKISGRKVFYHSNRGGAQANAMDFAADLPLWPGSNQVVVVVRENEAVKSSSVMILYRTPEKTAAVTR